MAKLKAVDADGQPYGYRLRCPGCGGSHVVVTAPGKDAVGWQFNGDLERPTFSPSLLVRWGNADGEQVCHSFVRDGRIEYLGDSTHHLSGQTVELPEVEA